MPKEGSRKDKLLSLKEEIESANRDLLAELGLSYKTSDSGLQEKIEKFVWSDDKQRHLFGINTCVVWERLVDSANLASKGKLLLAQAKLDLAKAGFKKIKNFFSDDVPF